MKIHIVQKGDTLWDISKQYGVDFNELQQVNSHISSPDMIMPGMKIKIPSSSKQVKQQTKPIKETQKKEQPKAPAPKPSPKPLAVQEDDHLKHKEIKKEMPKINHPEYPMMPTLPEVPPMMTEPKMTQQVQQQTTINIPEPKTQEMKPPKKKPAKEKVKKSEHKMPEMKPMPEMPMHFLPMPMMPMCYVMPNCCSNCCCHGHSHHHQMQMPTCNCHHTSQHFPSQQTKGWYMQRPINHSEPHYEGHTDGIYQYGNVEQNHQMSNPYDQYQQDEAMHKQVEPYPPFYRSTPESPPIPTPPNFAPQSIPDHQDSHSDNE